MTDDIRPRGTVTVKCQHPGCVWSFWLSGKLWRGVFSQIGDHGL